MDAEKASKKKKSPEKERATEKIVEEEAITKEEREEVVKEPAAKRKSPFLEKQQGRTKLEEDTEKDNSRDTGYTKKEAPIMRL
ncbi:hypothetical protein Tco_0152444 [Tanacetum coccineum]